MVAPLLIPIAAQIARVVATKGIRAAIKKFGKDVVKKNADKVPQLVRAKKIKEGAKIGEKYRKTKLPLERGARNTRAQDYKSRMDKAAKTRGRTKQAKLNKIERGEAPDRVTLLGRRGYNFEKGGKVGKAKKGRGCVMKGRG
jgi:hypothetical protein